MIKENSGNIFRFALDFEKGYAYAQIFDLSDLLGFSGKLIQVFNLIDNSSDSMADIQNVKSSGILVGPVPVNKFPNIRGKDSWKLISKTETMQFTPPIFKDYRGILNKNDWSELKPWYKEDRFENKFESNVFDYEDVRHLETIILNHLKAVSIKCTMMKIISEGDSVKNYYDLNEVGIRNTYLQIVNTYYPREVALKLLRVIG